MVRPSRGGFTLVETIVALTISSVIVILVATVFQVQNQYYALQLQRSLAHDNARVATESASRELRSVMSGAFVAASDHQLVVRTPMALAGVCAQPSPSTVSVHIDGGAVIDPGEVSGFAVRDSVTGAWSYYDGVGWSTINATGGNPALDCALAGADTVGATAQFHELRALGTYHGSLPGVGDLIMLYRKVELRFQPSAIEPNSIALYRGVVGHTLVELAAGMDSTAQFLYRTGGATYAAPISGAALDAIDAVRIVAEARRRAETGGRDDVTYGWSVNIHPRNGG